MTAQRSAWVLMVLAGATLAGFWYLDRAGKQQRLQADLESAGPAGLSASAPGGGPEATPPAAATSSGAPASAPAAPRQGQWILAAGSRKAAGKFVLGSLDPRSGYLFQVEFVREGAAVHTLKLATSFSTVDDRLLFDGLDGDHDKYEAARQADPGKYRGHYSLLNPVGAYRPYATRSVTVAMVGQEGSPTTIYLDEAPWVHEETRAVTQPAEGREIRFVATLHLRGAADAAGARPTAPALRLTKTYVVVKQDYSLQMRLKVENLLDAPMRIYLDQYGPTGVPLEDLYRGQDDRFLSVAKQEGGPTADIRIVERQHSEIIATKDGAYALPTGAPVILGRSDESPAVLWAGYCNKFFGSVMYLRPQFPQRKAAVAWQADFHFLPAPESPTSRAFITAVRVGGSRPDPKEFRHAPGMLLTSDQPREMVFDVFAGPKKRDMFVEAGAAHFRQQYKDLNYVGTISLKSCFCAWDALTLGMMWLLQWISKYLTFGNYGVAIMILVVLVRVALHYFSRMSQVNMMKMQELAPQAAELKKKFANDKEKLQKAMMELYKKQGATPLWGCLPMLLQMPIWIALWGSLSAAVELRHAPFLPVWITDLAGPDALVEWGGDFTLPLVGGMMGPLRGFNLLPLLLTVAMFLQTKLNPQMTQTTVAPTPEQETQKKMMQWMMPAMMLLIFYNAASGLTLYIMTSTFAGVAEQYVIREHIKKKQAARGGAAPAPAASSSGPSGFVRRLAARRKKK